MYNQPLGLGQRRVRAGPYQVSRPQSPVPSVFFLLVFLVLRFGDDKAPSFNQPLNNWNVSNVEDMEGMFAGAQSFNQPLNNWNVSNVWYMEGMFYNATSFNWRGGDTGSGITN